MANEYKIQSIDRAFTLLEILASSNQPLSLDELSKRSDLNRNTVFKLLSSLQSWKMVRSESHRGYSLGYGFLRYSSVLAGNFPALHVAEDYINQVSENTGETSGLYIAQNRQVFCVVARESKQVVKRALSVGRTGPIHFGAAGKVLLSHKTNAERMEALGDLKEIKYSTGEVISLEQFFERLDRIKEDGKAVSVMEGVIDVWAVAAPVFDEQGRVIASIGTSGPINRYEENHVAFCLSETKKASDELSRKIREITS